MLPMLAVICQLPFTLQAQLPDDTFSNDSIHIQQGDTLYERWQVSVLPYVGSNGKLSGQTINEYSINILGGHSLGNQRLELATLFNTNKGNVKGLQAAGLFNYTKGSLDGVQVAGLFNRADTLRGMQIGLFNFSDTTSGVPLGLVSYVNKGYHLAEITFDETFRLNLAFHTGVRSLHNIIALGYGQRNEGSQAWYFGYGLGTAPKLGERFALSVQLISMWVDNADPPTFNLLNRFILGLDYSLGNVVSVHVGGQINGLIFEDGSQFPLSILPQRQEPLSRESIGDGYVMLAYLGGRVGLRFRW